MDTMRKLSCRLCAINLENKKYKNIFDETTNLSQIITETIPINLSPDDGSSKQICLICYEKVLHHYKFIQDILKRENENDDSFKISQDISRKQKAEIIDKISKAHNDTVYSCPNCNVDLMILLSTNPQGCDYMFQISLAIVADVDKLQCAEHVQNTMSTKNHSHIHKDDEYIVENIDNEYIIPESIEKSTESLDETSNKSNKENYTKGEKNMKRKYVEVISRETSPSDIKAPKIEMISYETDPELLTYTYDCMDALVKFEPESEEVTWLDTETECMQDNVDQYGKETPKIDTKSEENHVYRPWPRYTCDLCGARYLSELKYEFHLERHKANKMDKFVCTLCDKEASNENLLWDHYFHTHKSVKRYVCTECGKQFMKRPRLNNHHKKYKHSGMKEILVDAAALMALPKNVTTDEEGRIVANCNLCGKLITDLDPDAINDLVTCADCDDSTLSLMVDGDEAKVILPRQYHCSKCPKHFVRKERLEFHEMRHNENMKEFICSTCGKEFSAENSLYEHYLFVHKGARPHICELCGKSFQLKARLKEHHRTHTGERPYQCDICGQRCMTTNALRLHRKIHFSQNRYTCNICDKSFSKKQNMNEHLEKHWKHDKNVALPQLFTCSICLEDFPTYRMLKYHMTELHNISSQDPILTEQKPWYECADCHEKFKHQMSLKAHREKVHEGRVTPVFECDACNVTYKIKQLLINHIKSKHGGEKRYKCAQCKKGFNDTKSLYNHILLHTGKKPYVCEYCNMSFRRKDSRDHHRRKHTGEQPYQCPDCGESFATYNSRSKHRKKEHGESELECPECGEKCNSQQEVRIHLNKHLGEKLKKLENEEQCDL